MVNIEFGNESKKLRRGNGGLNIEKEDVDKMTSAQLKIFNEEGEKEYNFRKKGLSENEWIKKLVNKNIYLIEYGDKWKKLEEITQEDFYQANDHLDA